ncbi:MAG TPA: YdhR family protein [Amaricoccus sp.]|uniref:YdhR family protein n=1 Tax=Amaricoccus sp. TaxID=1872485 RepID=UPI002BA29F12|nr:YdhR family protein [Amaricoccus sp.]HMQ94868.1 YdhR family protein [Amaricoccus sp.]HMR54673.1 YdhR family protein [Amaricoccus sp.]HMU01705.1 YdhR family protein [Amaricoccus sp.]
MTPTLILVTYRLRVPVAEFRAHARTAAARIAEAPGLLWKVWGLDEATGLGTSAYLFRDSASAEAFAEGPATSELRAGPAMDVFTRIAPVDAGLSAITGAARFLAPTDMATG